MKKLQNFLFFPAVAGTILMAAACSKSLDNTEMTPVDYVNPYMGNISHLLVPTFPTVQLPNSMLRVYPNRADFTGDRLFGLPVIVTNHRENSAFILNAVSGNDRILKPIEEYSYDNEVIKPYYYNVYLDEENINVAFAPGHQSALYRISFEKEGSRYVVLTTRRGDLKVEGDRITGFQALDDKTRVFVSMEPEVKPVEFGILGADGKVDTSVTTVSGDTVSVVM